MLARLSRLSPLWLTVGFGLLTLVPLLALAYFAITRSSAAVEREATARVESTAAIAADFVDAELGGLIALVDGYAKRPSLVHALANGDPRRYDRERIAFHVGELQKTRAGIALSFLAQPSGHLVTIVPPTPEIVGDDFSFRDWYRGVMAARAPYVSEAYVTAARTREPVIAAAAPVRGGSPERIIGILVAAYGLEYIHSFARRLQRDQGTEITITDQAGVIVASPRVQPDELVSIAGDPHVQAALRGEHGVSAHSGEDGADVAAYGPVAAYGWTVTASVPRQTAFASVRQLRNAVLSITALLGLLLAVGIAALGLTLHRRARLEALERESRAAAEAARDELEHQNVELETQAVELETQAVELEESQSKLAAANDELEAQQAELERALAELSEEKDLVERSYRFAAQLAEETDVAALAALMLDRIAGAAAAEIGLVQIRNDGAFEVAATRGVAPESIAPVTVGVGLAGRALEEARIVAGDHGENGFVVDTFGGRAPVRHELHVPLLHAERCLGVLSLGRLAHREWSAAERDAVAHLAGQGAIALANALALREVRRLADVNRAVLDATTDAIRMVDLDGRTVVANAAMAKLAGQVLALDDSLTIWETTAELAQRTTDPDAYLQALKRLQDDPEREAIDVYRLAQSGVWIQRYSAPVREAEGSVVGRIFVLRDITAEREAQQLKSDLVATVSHELRTPLTGILGFAELLATHETDEASRQSYAETIRREAGRLGLLINDFLDVQRIEAGDFRLTLAQVRLDEVVREQATIFDTHDLHELELDVEPGIMVLGERDRITQVLSNLISNAVKYSPAGGTIRVSARASGATVRVEVADSGIGIPAEQQPRIFEKFFRVDSSDTRRIGGTGLGLALTRDIVEAHGGTIGFTSTEGLGSTFWFELPRVEQDVVAGVSETLRRVLVVEDDAGTSELLRAQLEEDGYEVDVVASGEEALTYVERSVPAAICLDIGLSGRLDGWEVLTRLKSNPATAGIPVIVCTGSEQGDRAAVFGAADFLTKPVSRERLLDAVARLVPAGRGSILVVDDDATVRRLVTTTLASDGLTVREAADGAEALLRITEEQPDVILLDLTMPVLDGFGVLERLLENPETRGIPVIVLTARIVTPEERKRLRDRAVTVIEKSAYSAQELRRLVQQAAA